MKKTSLKALLASAPPEVQRSEKLTEDVNEILNKVAKEDKLIALARQRRTLAVVGDDKTADNLLEMLKKGLRSAP